MKNRKIKICPECGEESLCLSETVWYWYDIVLKDGIVVPGERHPGDDEGPPFRTFCCACHKEWDCGEFAKLVNTGEYDRKIQEED